MCFPLTKMTLNEEYTGLWDWWVYFFVKRSLHLYGPPCQNSARESTNRSTSKLSSDGSLQRALAIRAKQFKDRCKEMIVSPTGP